MSWIWLPIIFRLPTNILSSMVPVWPLPLGSVCVHPSFEFYLLTLWVTYTLREPWAFWEPQSNPTAMAWPP